MKDAKPKVVPFEEHEPVRSDVSSRALVELGVADESDQRIPRGRLEAVKAALDHGPALVARKAATRTHVSTRSGCDSQGYTHLVVGSNGR